MMAQAGKMSAPPKPTEPSAASSADVWLDQIKEAAKGSGATFACGGTKNLILPVRLYFQGLGTEISQPVTG